MKFSENWLHEWVKPPVKSEVFANALTMLGLEVELFTAIGHGLAEIVVGIILSAEQHPNADRLRVCQVRIGEEAAPLTIVCGAANARAGIKVAIALVGALLPGNLKIKQAKIRGVESSGMLCSFSELGLSETSEGIMELAADAPLGQAIVDYLQLPDQIIDVNITPNRGDCLSILGIARETAAFYKLPLTTHAETAVATTITDTLTLKIENPEKCPRYIGRIIRHSNPRATTPLWMQERLRRSGIRSIHPVVDVTNYVMLELGQPLHAFDLATLVGGIQVRDSVAGEQATLLKGETITLNAPALVIADQEKILAIAGIMGGAASAVTATTVDLFIESAFFPPAVITPTLRRTALQSDAAYRYERGVDPELPMRALERATTLLLAIVGGEAGPVVAETHVEHLPQPAKILLRRKRILRILGVALDDDTVIDLLQRLNMQIDPHTLGWEVTPPSYRFDLRLEIDLIEELIRLYGYNNIPAHHLTGAVAILPLPEHTLSLSRIRQFWLSQGYSEVINYSFVNQEMALALAPAYTPLMLSNPLAADMAAMRTSLWPGLIQAALFNLNRQQTRLRLIEFGVCFIEHEGAIQQQPRVAGLVIGSVAPEQWGLAAQPVNFFDIKGDVEQFLALTGEKSMYEFKAAKHPALHPGRCAELVRDGVGVGYIGELHPSLQQQWDLQTPVYLFEFMYLPIAQVKLPLYSIPSKYPSIRRDLAFIVAETISYQQIKDRIQQCVGDILKSLHLFDIYQGRGIPVGQKSIALGLTFQQGSRTLVDSEVDEAITQVVATLKQDFQAVLRG